MGDKTGIGWTNATWNFVRGCRRVSEGCRNCYAEIVAARSAGEGEPYEGLASYHPKSGEARWTGEGLFVPEKLDQPLRWSKPRMIFVNSMSDLFFEVFYFEEIAAAFAVMAMANKHTFQILTKRPERAAEFFHWLEGEPGEDETIIDACLKHLRKIHKPTWEMAIKTPLDLFHRPSWPLPNVWMGVSAEDHKAAEARVPALLQMPAAVRFV